MRISHGSGIVRLIFLCSAAVIGAVALGVEQTASATPVSTAHAAVDRSGLPSGRTTYRTIADYNRDMVSLAARHPGLVKLFKLPYLTTAQRPVFGVEISADVKHDAAKPAILITGIHHGNEWASGDVTMEFGIDLVQHFGHDGRITRLLSKARVILVPVVNVDGFIANQRRTADNVDMNRNYGFGWQPLAAGSAGSGPDSEPETRNVEYLVSNNQVNTFLTMHTCESLILYPPISTDEGQPQDQDRFVALAQQMAAQTGYGYKTSADDYPTTGEAISWAYYAARTMAFTIEDCTTPLDLPRTFQTLVVDQYLGTGAYAGKGMRGAFLTAVAASGSSSQYGQLTGRAPRGAVLRLSKSFSLFTHPLPDTGKTQPVAQHLDSTLKITSSNGRFDWAVNPSIRPVPAYQADGVHPDHPGFYEESWTLTCATPAGRILQTANVTVALGQKVRVNLRQCTKAYPKR